jgi:S-methylmethionine-dependent homocysteine/selenocysteine methylase
MLWDGGGDRLPPPSDGEGGGEDMALYRHHPPQLDAELFLTDGGMETTLLFLQGYELPEFAAFPLLFDEMGRSALESYYDSYCEIAAGAQCGIVLDSPTWRASTRWGARLGYDEPGLDEVNRVGVQLLVEQRRRHAGDSTPVVISGCIGPYGDGYAVTEALTSEEARDYHAAQIASLADTDADLVTALTLNYVEEAVGLTRAAADEAMPVVISFTVETDGRLPSGTSLGDAITQVDQLTGSYPLYYMVNCAHPSHFLPVLDASARWADRLQGVRANASTLSHAELDQAESLDRGDPSALADDYRRIRDALPHLRVAGGCCGTDTEHVAAISRALAPA